jgi:hypothetical protein
MDIARQSIELDDEDRALRLARFSQRRGQLRTTIERVGAFAGLDFDEFAEGGRTSANS